MKEFNRKYFIEKDFTEYQIDTIEKEFVTGVDMEKFLTPAQSTSFIKDIAEALRQGINLNQYLAEGYTPLQVGCIAAQLIRGKDVTRYLKPNISPHKMQILFALSNPESYTNPVYTTKDLAGVLNGNLVVYPAEVKENSEQFKFDSDQVKEIMIGIDRHLDTCKYTSIDFSSPQMREIRVGLEQGVDVSKYAYPHLIVQQMRNIRKALYLKLIEPGDSKPSELAKRAEEALKEKYGDEETVDRMNIVFKEGAIWNLEKNERI